MSNERIRRLPRIALPEIEDLGAVRRGLAFRVLDAHERIRGLGGQDRGDVHDAER
jgi:hypothetical protein